VWFDWGLIDAAEAGGLATAVLPDDPQT